MIVVVDITMPQKDLLYIKVRDTKVSVLELIDSMGVWVKMDKDNTTLETDGMEGIEKVESVVMVFGLVGLDLPVGLL